MINLDNITKKFDRKTVIDGVTLKIAQGDIVGLLGPNGAGKTTTLRMITGVLPASSGTITIKDMDLFQHDQEIKALIGYLPENNPLYEEMTVEEHLKFWAELKGISKEKTNAALDFAVKSTGIAEVFYRPIAELSKGFRQRVGLAQAILTKPSILILDEPTEGLDPNQRKEIQNLIQTLGKDRTIVISSHVLSEVAKICNRMVIIHKGKIVADTTPSRIGLLSNNAKILELEIKGHGVKQALEHLPGVVKVKEEHGDCLSLEISKDADIREQVFRLAVEKSWVILTMHQKQVELEDVFSQLTKD